MLSTLFLSISAPSELAVNELTESVDIGPGLASQRGRELFPMLVGQKCAKFCDARGGVKPTMSLNQDAIVIRPVKALEMLALNDDLETMVKSDSYCTRRH